MLTVREYTSGDWPALWAIMEPVFRAGETYAFDPAITKAEAQRVWIEETAATYVAVDETGMLLGTYYIKPNQPGLGAHVCNCGYIVAAAARGQGIASRLCEHSQDEARRLGFRAMQFNLVISTNTRAVRLWQAMGFAIVGRLPGAFQHPRHGYVDALVLFQTL